MLIFSVSRTLLTIGGEVVSCSRLCTSEVSWVNVASSSPDWRFLISTVSGDQSSSRPSTSSVRRCNWRYTSKISCFNYKTITIFHINTIRRQYKQSQETTSTVSGDQSSSRPSTSNDRRCNWRYTSRISCFNYKTITIIVNIIVSVIATVIGTIIVVVIVSSQLSPQLSPLVTIVYTTVILIVITTVIITVIIIVMVIVIIIVMVIVIVIMKVLAILSSDAATGDTLLRKILFKICIIYLGADKDGSGRLIGERVDRQRVREHLKLSKQTRPIVNSDITMTLDLVITMRLRCHGYASHLLQLQ